jgi:hypothetical protein
MRNLKNTPFPQSSTQILTSSQPHLFTKKKTMSTNAQDSNFQFAADIIVWYNGSTYIFLPSPPYPLSLVSSPIPSPHILPLPTHHKKDSPPSNSLHLKICIYLLSPIPPPLPLFQQQVKHPFESYLTLTHAPNQSLLYHSCIYIHLSCLS